MLDGTYEKMCKCTLVEEVRHDLEKVQARLDYIKGKLDELEGELKPVANAYFYNSHVDILGEDEK